MKTLIMKLLAFLGIVPKDTSHTAAVVIGVEKGKYGSCPGAIADSSRMKNLLRDYTKDVTLLQNNQATRAAVSVALSKGASKDLLIVYYSGHGGQAGRGDSSEADGKDEYLCLYDGALYDNDIWKVVNMAKRTFLIFDCCHSETMYRAIEARTAQVRAAGEGPTMLCWSGCPDNTYSYGDVDGGKFTNAFMKAFDRRMTYGQVWTRLSNDAGLKSYQTPRKTQIGKWTGLVFR